MIKNFLNPEGHEKNINGLKVTSVLLKGCILPIGGASSVEGLQSTGLTHLVFWEININKKNLYLFKNAWQVI